MKNNRQSSTHLDDGWGSVANHAKKKGKLHQKEKGVEKIPHIEPQRYSV